MVDENQIDLSFQNGWNSCLGRLKSLLNEKKLNDPNLLKLIDEMEVTSDDPLITSEDTLPPIIKDTMTMDISPQISVTLFPPPEGQPDIDIIKLELKQIEGGVSQIYATPCEALEISQALMSAVQFYLYNQEQYRTEILEPRLNIAKHRNEFKTEVTPANIKPLEPLRITIHYNSSSEPAEELLKQICQHFSIPYMTQGIINSTSDIPYIEYILGVNE